MKAPCKDAVDLEHLQELVGADHEALREISELYRTTARRYLAGMRAALESQIPWRTDAHALKGASANFGAHRIRALAARAEELGPQQNLLRDMEEALHEAERFLEDRDLLVHRR